MVSNSASFLSSSKRRASVISHSHEPNAVLINDIINEFETLHDASWTDVLHIRDEIVDKAMQICYENYLQKQAAKFFVQCSYEAWMKILRLKFYAHDSREEFYDHYPKFGPDKPPLPSIPDTWAANSVQIYDPQFKGYDEDIASHEEDENTSIQPNITVSTGDQHSHTSYVFDLNVKDSIKSDTVTSAAFQVQEEAVDEILVPNPSEVSLEGGMDITSAIPSNTPSYFTTIAKASAKRDTLPIVLSKTNPHKDRRSRQKFPKIKTQYTCNDTQHPKNIQLEDLPPVRAPTTFKYNVFTEEERKKMEHKKNSKLN